MFGGEPRERRRENFVSAMFVTGLLIQACYEFVLTSLLQHWNNKLVPSCWQACYKFVGDNLATAFSGQPCYKIVNKLQQVCWNKLSQAVRTHPGDKLLEQHCYKSAAGLLQLVRFYVCSSKTFTSVHINNNAVIFAIYSIKHYSCNQEIKPLVAVMNFQLRKHIRWSCSMNMLST